LAFVMPSLPLRHHDEGGGDSATPAIDLTVLSQSVAEAGKKRDEAYDTSRKMQAAMIPIRDKIGTAQAASELEAFHQAFATFLPKPKDRSVREANLSERVEELVRLTAYQHFLETGTLLPPVDWATDEEYLAGALMGLARDLQQYGMGRATVRDVSSVQAACDLVSACMDYLLELDFRNGPLRRKYDGTKYSLKALETFLYELAVTSLSTETDGGAPGTSKRQKRDGLLPADELAAVKVRMEHRDELREILIKNSRDGQKAAKQSIFALHRGDRPKAAILLQQCEACVKDQLLPIVSEEPLLRFGSFANVVEEYVEARLFAVWLHGKDYESDTTMEEDGANANGTILLPEDFSSEILPLDAEEYLGGLCDLTGEIGRFAVQLGTARDLHGVKQCLQSNGDICTNLQLIDRLPKFGKKLDAVRTSVEKLERMLYEMSLSEAAGGRAVQSDAVMPDKEEEE
jgi:predicted translin family RNA/ssDNA-binding protein